MTAEIQEKYSNSAVAVYDEYVWAVNKFERCEPTSLLAQRDQKWREHWLWLIFRRGSRTRSWPQVIFLLLLVLTELVIGAAATKPPPPVI